MQPPPFKHPLLRLAVDIARTLKKPKHMVRIIKHKMSTSNDGKIFISLKVQGGVEPVQSLQTGKLYLTAKSAYVATTFDEQTAKALIGTELPGTVVKVASEPYDYIVKETGETMTLTHRYEYQLEDKPMIESQAIAPENVQVFANDLLEA